MALSLSSRFVITGGFVLLLVTKNWAEEEAGVLSLWTAEEVCRLWGHRWLSLPSSHSGRVHEDGWCRETSSIWSLRKPKKVRVNSSASHICWMESIYKIAVWWATNNVLKKSKSHWPWCFYAWSDMGERVSKRCTRHRVYFSFLHNEILCWDIFPTRPLLTWK